MTSSIYYTDNQELFTKIKQNCLQTNMPLLMIDGWNNYQVANLNTILNSKSIFNIFMIIQIKLFKESGINIINSFINSNKNKIFIFFDTKTSISTFFPNHEHVEITNDNKTLILQSAYNLCKKH